MICLLTLSYSHIILEELHIDRAYLNSTFVKNRSQELTIICKAWPVRNGKHFNKSAFTLDWGSALIHCSHQVAVPFHEGQVVHFPADVC